MAVYYLFRGVFKGFPGVLETPKLWFAAEITTHGFINL